MGSSAARPTSGSRTWSTTIHFTEQPYTPDEGYHLSKGPRGQVDPVHSATPSQIAPEKPWLMYLCPEATHAPHHTPKEWADKYKGKFDMGYEKYREIVLENMKEDGHDPRGHAALGDQSMARARCDPGKRPRAAMGLALG